MSLARHCLAAVAEDVPNVEPHTLVGIIVLEDEHGLGFEHLDSELLVELALERRERRFAGFFFSAREFPGAGERGPWRPTVHEPTAVRVADEAHDDIDDARARHEPWKSPKGYVSSSGRGTA